MKIVRIAYPVLALLCIAAVALDVWRAHQLSEVESHIVTDSRVLTLVTKVTEQHAELIGQKPLTARDRDALQAELDDALSRLAALADHEMLPEIIELRRLVSETPANLQDERYAQAVITRLSDLARKIVMHIGEDTTERAWSRSGTFALLIALISLVAIFGAGVGVVGARRHERWLSVLANDLRRLAAGERTVETTDHGTDTEMDAIARALRFCARAMVEADEAKASITSAARSDPLTGLGNRRALGDALADLSKPLPEGVKDDRQVALLHVDLDHFKSINDRLGHDAGDFVLTEAARRMRSVLGEHDVLARIGGDEFVMVMVFAGGPEELARRAGALVQKFSEPILYRHNLCAVGISVGAVIAGSVGQVENTERLLINADLALGKAKAAGRNRYTIFDPSMARNYDKEREIAEELHRSFSSGAFETWFQPMVEAGTRRLTGVEMLVRWRHPERGLVLPSKFLAIAESRNLTQEISAETIPRACRQLREWLDSGLDVPKLYLNLSRSELLLPGMVDRLRWILEDADLTPDRIAVEVEEEDCAGRGVELIFANLAELRAMGVEIVLEGFGATDASISNVIELGVGKIKLSRTIIDRMREPEDHAKVLPLLKGMIGFGCELGIVMVGKGVSAPSQITMLRRLGCTELQGDAIAPAMSEQVTRQWLARFANGSIHETEKRTATA